MSVKREEMVIRVHRDPKIINLSDDTYVAQSWDPDVTCLSKNNTLSSDRVDASL